VVEAFARNPKGELKPGMFATVRLLVGEDEQPTVPLAALRTDGTTNRLFLARSGEAFEMIVRTGETKDGRVALLEPLDDSAAVILNPPPDLHDGSAIQ
jgi:membrane fusion protein (multidrug efflux system)